MKDEHIIEDVTKNLNWFWYGGIHAAASKSEKRLDKADRAG
jgi:hypothetical protein